MRTLYMVALLELYREARDRHGLTPPVPGARAGHRSGHFAVSDEDFAKQTEAFKREWAGRGVGIERPA